MSNQKIFVVLIILRAALQAKLIEEKNFGWDSGRLNISNHQQELSADFENLLSELAKNRSNDYEIDVVLSSNGCSVCNRILGVLMKTSLQSFLTINDASARAHSGIDQDGSIVSDVSHYRSVLLLTENALEFLQLFANLRLNSAWNPRARHLIFTAKKPAEEELEMIFEECWSRKVLNVAVITKNHREAFTYNPYLQDQLKKREEVDWSRLFYDKLENMNEFSIRIKFIPFSSHSVIKWIQEGGRMKFFGTDFGYAELFVKSVNATPEYVNLTADTIDLYSNFTYRQVFWQQRTFRNVDMWLNEVPIHTRFHERYEKSYPVSVNNLRILVPKSALKTPNIFVPYNDVTWICVVVSLMIFTLYSSVLYKFRGIDDNAFLRIFGIFMGKGLVKRSYGLVEKFTFFLFTMFSLLILSAYQGALYGALTTVTYYPEIDTLSELYERINAVHTYEDIAEYFQDYVKSFIKVFAFGSGDSVEFMKTHSDDAYAFPDGSAQYEGQRRVLSQNGVPLFHVMNDNALPGFQVMVVPYGSPYLEKLERALMACREAGLTDYWEAESRFYDLLIGTIIVPGGAEERTPKKLSLQTQITGFYIWGTGLLAGCLCCAAEIFFHKYGKTIKLRLKKNACT